MGNVTDIKKPLQEIADIYAYTTKNDGVEGLIVVAKEDGSSTVMIGTSLEQVAPYQDLVQDLASKTGLEVELVKFSGRTLLSVTKPQKILSPAR